MSTYLLLLEAVRSEDLGFLQDFVKENYNEININDGDDDGVTAVHIAAGLEKNIMLEYLLNHGSAIDSQTQEGLTPLHVAAMWGRSEQVATLLNHKADCSIVDSNGYNAVMHAVNSQEDGSQTCVDLILSHQENRNGYSKENFEELLTELSSGLSSPGQVSSADSNSPTFSYSTITRLASLTNVECSEYGTMHGYGSDILTECSTSDDLSTEEQKDVDEVTDDDTCIYETADEEIEEDLKKGNQNHGSLGRMEYGRANKGNIQGVKEKGIEMGS
ncbi:ankyrin-3-like isoform X2, partial [Paramuricea clavata]